MVEQVKKRAMVSVLIPAHNCARYLPEAIESVLAQTYRNYEIVLIDDGSTDETPSIIRNYCQSAGSRIRFFEQKNKGVAFARNTAIQKAQGEYLAFLDADDVWLPEKLEKQVALLERNPHIGFVYSDTTFIDEKGQNIPQYVRKTKLIRGDILSALFEDLFLMIPSIVLRRSCLQKTGEFDEKLRTGEDYDFLLRLAMHFHADFVPEKLWKRRVHLAGLSRGDHVANAETDIGILLRFKDDNPEFYKKNKVRVRIRLAGYYLIAGYRCLQEGRNLLAVPFLLKSLRYRISGKAVKNLFLCLFPLTLKKFLKKLCQK